MVSGGAPGDAQRAKSVANKSRTKAAKKTPIRRGAANPQLTLTMNWRDYSNLRTGDEKQRQAFATLKSLNIFEKLQGLDPALVGTVWLRLDIPGSDLDIICELDRSASFESIVTDAFGGENRFETWTRSSGEQVARFETAILPVEIFAKDEPIEQQYAWRHLSVMARLLDTKAELREQVRSLKHMGLSTEKAFAKLLNLEGDPYEALLDLEEASDKQIAEMCRRCAV